MWCRQSVGTIRLDEEGKWLSPAAAFARQPADRIVGSTLADRIVGATFS
jgi:hypothetical protein